MAGPAKQRKRPSGRPFGENSAGRRESRRDGKERDADRSAKGTVSGKMAQEKCARSSDRSRSGLLGGEEVEPGQPGPARAVVPLGKCAAAFLEAALGMPVRDPPSGLVADRNPALLEQPAVDAVAAAWKRLREADLPGDRRPDGEVARVAEAPVAERRMARHIALVLALDETGEPRIVGRPGRALKNRDGLVFEELARDRDPVGRTQTVGVREEEHLAGGLGDGRVRAGYGPRGGSRSRRAGSPGGTSGSRLEPSMATRTSKSGAAAWSASEARRSSIRGSSRTGTMTEINTTSKV